MPDTTPPKPPRRTFARTVPPRHDNPATWLHRGEAAKILGTSRDGVRRLEERGALHPIRDAFGDVRLDPDEVNAFGAGHPKFGTKIWDDGDVTAAAFKLFAQKVPRREVVQRLRITCDRADTLYEEWLTADFPTAIAARQRRREAARVAEQARAKEQKRRRLTDALKTLRTTLARPPGEPNPTKGGS